MFAARRSIPAVSPLFHAHRGGSSSSSRTKSRDKENEGWHEAQGSALYRCMRWNSFFLGSSVYGLLVAAKKHSFYVLCALSSVSRRSRDGAHRGFVGIAGAAPGSYVLTSASVVHFVPKRPSCKASTQSMSPWSHKTRHRHQHHSTLNSSQHTFVIVNATLTSAFHSLQVLSNEPVMILFPHGLLKAIA